MNRDELVQWLQKPEDNFVERKPQGVNKSDIRRTLVAFANSVPADREAVLFIGVRDDGRIEGCSATDERQKAVREACNECYPPVVATCEVINVEGREVLAVVVGASNNRPHFAGQAYLRRGSESIVASKDQFDELVHSRNSLVAAILALKDQVVTVVGLQHKLGETMRVVDSAYRERHECKVETANARVVRLTQLSVGRSVVEPLDHITVTYDAERQRPMLVVTGYS